MSFDTDRFVVLMEDETPLQAKMYEVLYNGLDVPSVGDVQSHVDRLSSAAHTVHQEALCALGETPKLARYMWGANYSVASLSLMYGNWNANRPPVTSLQVSLYACAAAYLCRVLCHCVYRRMLYKKHCKIFKVS